jgi:hypothetical protein
MASNVPITPGSGAVIKTDDVGGGEQVQYIKLDLGVTGASSPVSGSVPITGNVGIVGYDGATTRPILTDTSGRTITVARLQDGSGTAITSTLVGAKQRLDVTLGSGVAPGATAPAYMDVVGGTDGSLARAFLTDTSGRLAVRADAQRNTTAGSTDYGVPALGVVQDTRSSTGVTDGNYGMPRLSNLGAVDVRASQSVSATGSVTSAAVLVKVDCQDQQSVSVQITAMPASTTLVFEQSSDDVTYYQCPMVAYAASTATAGTYIISATAVGLWACAVPARWFRVRCSVYGGSGTATAIAITKQTPFAPHALGALLGSGSNVIGSVTTGYATTGAGALRSHLVAAGSTNATVVKASAGRLLGVDVTNTAATVRYLKFHNQTTAPTAGTGVVRTIGIPAGTSRWINMDGGEAFTTGIGFTTVTGSADADTAAVTAGDLIIDVLYI